MSVRQWVWKCVTVCVRGCENQNEICYRGKQQQGLHKELDPNIPLRLWYLSSGAVYHEILSWSGVYTLTRTWENQVADSSTPVETRALLLNTSTLSVDAVTMTLHETAVTSSSTWHIDKQRRIPANAVLESPCVAVSQKQLKVATEECFKKWKLGLF